LAWLHYTSYRISIIMARSGINNRGGKDGISAPPIDQHRKRIGQETRKEKQVNKEIKRQHQAKESRQEDFKDSALILLAVAGIFALIYICLFFALKKETEPVV